MPTDRSNLITCTFPSLLNCIQSNIYYALRSDPFMPIDWRAIQCWPTDLTRLLLHFTLITYCNAPVSLQQHIIGSVVRSVHAIASRSDQWLPSQMLTLNKWTNKNFNISNRLVFKIGIGLFNQWATPIWITRLEYSVFHCDNIYIYPLKTSERISGARRSRFYDARF